MKHNPVARNCRKFNRAVVHRDRKKAQKLGRKPKHPVNHLHHGG